MLPLNPLLFSGTGAAVAFALGLSLFSSAASAAGSATPTRAKAEASPGKTSGLNAGSLRPTLAVHRGRYFGWSAPSGWGEQETTNGVTLIAPDGVTSVSSALLMRSSGNTSPAQFAARMLSMVPGLQNARVLAVRNLPNQPSGFGPPWVVQEIDMVYSQNGAPMQACWTVGIVNAWGTFDAFMLGYQSPTGVFAQKKFWLAPIARSVSCINAREVAGNHTIMLPKNNPLDNSGLIESWRQKGLSEDRISKAQREGTMGYERAKDSTGRVYNMPLETWDATVGGYRNPTRPNEILQQTEPGE